MKFLRDIKIASEFLFFLVGTFLLVALLFWRNDFYAYEAELFLRYAAFPFSFIGLIFAGTSIRLAFVPEAEARVSAEQDVENENPVLDAVLIVVGLIIFFGLLYLEIGLPDKI